MLFGWQLRDDLGSDSIVLGVGWDQFDLLCSFFDWNYNCELIVSLDFDGESENILFWVLNYFDQEWGGSVGDRILVPDVFDAWLG